MLHTLNRRLVSVAALATLALGLTACDGGDGGSSPSGTGDVSGLSPAEAVLASFQNLSSQSYKMESTVSVNDIEFVTSTSLVNGDAMHTSQDMHMSAMLEVAGQGLPQDPALRDMMGQMFQDTHTESILVDGVYYFQLTGGMYSSLTEQYGPDAWFTVDVSEQPDLNELYSEIGSFDLAAQTETLLNSLSDLRETSPGVYTGTLNPNAEPMQALLGSMGTLGTGANAFEGIEMVITLDNSGRLKSMEMTMPEMEGMTMRIVTTVVEVGGDYSIAAPQSTNLHSFDDLVNFTG